MRNGGVQESSAPCKKRRTAQTKSQPGQEKAALVTFSTLVFSEISK
jgi:hypothetical protein